MVTTRRGGASAKSKQGFPPLSPSAGSSRRGSTVSTAGTKASRSRSGSTSSVGTSLAQSASAASSVASDEPDSDDDILQPALELKPPRTPRKGKKNSAASVTSTGSNRREKLDLTVEKKLLQEIEARGGIDKFTDGYGQGLSAILDLPENSHLFAFRGDPIRKKLSRRVQCLRNKTPAHKCTALLESYKIKPAPSTRKRVKENLHPVASVSTKAKQENLSDLDEDDDERSEAIPVPDVIKSVPDTVESNPTKLTAPVLKARRRTASVAPPQPVSVASIKSRKPSSVRPDLPIQDTAQENMSDTEAIELDPDSPWLNPEDILITKFKEMECGKCACDGINIMVVGDPRDVAKDRFQLKFHERKPGNIFELTKPALPAGLWLDREDFETDETANSAIVRGLKGAMQGYKDLDDEAKKKKFLITIKDGSDMKLTDKLFLQADVQHDELDVKKFNPTAVYDTGQTFKNETTGKQEVVLNISTCVSWRLVDMSTKRKLEDDDKKETGSAGVAQALARKRAKLANRVIPSLPTAPTDIPMPPVPEHPLGGSPKAEGMELDSEPSEQDFYEPLDSLDDFQISDAGWSEIEPMLNEFISQSGGDIDKEIQKVYETCEQNAIDICLKSARAEDITPFDIETKLVQYVRGQIAVFREYQEAKRGKQSSSKSASTLENDRKKLFKPLSIEGARSSRTKTQENKRKERRNKAVNRARGSGLPSLEDLGKEIEDAQNNLPGSGNAPH